MSVVSEITDGFDLLSGYFDDLRQYLISGGTPTDPNDLSGVLDYANLLTYCLDEAQQGAGFAVGAAQEAIATFVGVERELGLAVLTKAEIYANQQSDNQDESKFYGQAGAFFSGVVKGAPTNGSQC